MKNVEVVASVDQVGTAKVDLDGHTILVDSGSQTVGVGPGKHILQWYVLGPKGTQYSIAIEAPEEAAFKYDAVLTDDQKSAGFKKFMVNKEVAE